MLRGYDQDFARSDVYAMFYHWQFARGFRLVPKPVSKDWSSGNTLGGGGHTKLSLLPSELRLEAELSSHCLLGHYSGIKDVQQGSGASIISRHSPVCPPAQAQAVWLLLDLPLNILIPGN